MKEGIHLTGKQLTLRQRRTNNSFRVLFLLLLVVAVAYVLRGVLQKEIASPFEPTAVPTRTSSSYALEGETHFLAGNLNAAIEAYQKATRYEPNNADLWAELARIQTYSSASLATDAEQRQRLQEALQSIDTAVKIAPDDGFVHAIRSFVLDWNGSSTLAGDKAQEYLAEAEQEAIRALTLDKSALALAYYAEILVDQQRLVQAEQNIALALELDPGLMDVHRVRAIVQESSRNYSEAIKEYKKAVEITPNLTFLHIKIGVNYRQLRQYEVALEWFNKAVQINKQLGVNDPIPYLAIGNTYSQLGEFYIAGLNVKTALKYNPTNPAVYGNLGMVYYKSRNYESSIPALKCAVRGCDAVTSCELRDCKTQDNLTVTGLPLSPSTVVFYYTYGSALAGMHKPGLTYCSDAVAVLREVREAFADDPTIISIIQPSEEICASYGFR